MMTEFFIYDFLNTTYKKVVVIPDEKYQKNLASPIPDFVVVFPKDQSRKNAQATNYYERP